MAAGTSLSVLRWRLGITAILGSLLAWSILYFFVCDDAFIAFRYARNLVIGEGLVFNRRERVEGYTSFLFVVQLAALWRSLGLRPEYAAPAIGWVSTIATGLGVVALAYRPRLGDPTALDRRSLSLVALALWASNRSVAVWTTSGLETRFFTALLTWSLVMLSAPLRTQRTRFAGSVLVGLAALTRPEALLIGPALLAWTSWDDRMRRTLDLRATATTWLPAGLLVGSHALWRWSYYHALLPNTWYAKNVRDWWDAGFTFLGYAGLEHALWWVVPLALAGAGFAWRRGDRTHLAWIFWAIPVYLELARIGGDHFEFRMFDPLWPPLYAAAAEGLFALVGGLRRQALVGYTLLLGVAIPLSHDVQALQRSGRAATEHLVVALSLQDSPWLIAVPPVPVLLPLYNAAARRLHPHSIAVRHREHQVFSQIMHNRWARFGEVEAGGVLPDDAVAAEGSIGYYGYYLWDLTLIDLQGLTDYTIARTPVTRSDSERQLAHDRDPPAGYLAARGVNIEIEGAHRTMEAALRDGSFAVLVAPGLWAGFEAIAPGYERRAFPGRTVHDRLEMADPFRAGGPAGGPLVETFAHRGTQWQVSRWLGRFDDLAAGPDGWTATGSAFARQPAKGAWLGQGTVSGFEGPGLVNSFHPSLGDRATGELLSPPFRVETGEALTWLTSGSATCAFALLADSAVVSTRRPNRKGPLKREMLVLDAWVGQELQVRVTDSGGTLPGHISLDGVALVRAAASP